MQSTTLPEAAKYVPNLQLSRARFDLTRISPGLQLDNENYSVEQVNSTNSHKSVYTLESVSEGRHYWAFKIVNGGANNSIMIGLGSSVPVTTSSYPGHSSDPGVSYYGVNGNRYSSNTHGVFGEGFTEGDEISMLANLDFGTVTFFKNQKLVGTAAGNDVIKTGIVYYPIVSLYQLGQKVISLQVTDNGPYCPEVDLSAKEV